MSRGRAIAAAIVGRAEMRAALQHFSRDTNVGLTWIKTVGLGPATRVLRDATGLGRIGLVPGGPPVGGPFPDIADHVVEAVAVRRKRRHGRGALIAVLAEILDREVALPGVRHVLAAGHQRIAPGELLAG